MAIGGDNTAECIDGLRVNVQRKMYWLDQLFNKVRKLWWYVCTSVFAIWILLIDFIWAWLINYLRLDLLSFHYGSLSFIHNLFIKENKLIIDIICYSESLKESYNFDRLNLFGTLIDPTSTVDDIYFQLTQFNCPDWRDSHSWELGQIG